MGRAKELWAAEVDRIGEMAASGEIAKESFEQSMAELGFDADEIADHWDAATEEI